MLMFHHRVLHQQHIIDVVLIIWVKMNLVCINNKMKFSNQFYYKLMLPSANHLINLALLHWIAIVEVQLFPTSLSFFLFLFLSVSMYMSFFFQCLLVLGTYLRSLRRIKMGKNKVAGTRVPARGCFRGFTASIASKGAREAIQGGLTAFVVGKGACDAFQRDLTAFIVAVRQPMNSPWAGAHLRPFLDLLESS